MAAPGMDYGGTYQPQYPGQPRYRPDLGPSFEKRKERAALSTDGVFMWTSILLLSTLMVIPIWNAVSLLVDENYTYWAGRWVPATMITACVGILAVYAATMLGFFKYARTGARGSELTVLMIVNMYITLFGLTLMLISLPLSRQASETYMNLSHRCDYSDQTHRTFEYWTVLHNIRSTPACAAMPSVEGCAGYEETQQTSFIKHMETTLRCSGFCYKPAPLANPATPGVVAGQQAQDGAAAQPAADAAAAQPAAAAQQPAQPAQPAQQQALTATVVHQRHDHRTSGRRHRMLSMMEFADSPAATSPFPPLLFSQGTAEASCEGMAARDMRNFAGDIGYQTFYQGIYLVFIAVITGFLKLVGFCFARDRSEVARTGTWPEAGAPGQVKSTYYG